ncbi:hypothetical protein AGMMS49975_23860 [Clostridia bacterium]|nr:hypothetical protein AGMMS49975_23860 [Clostridia bacterium]
MTNVLLIATQKYYDLMNKSYSVILGRNGKLTKINLTFSADEYKHIFGLHKLRDNDNIYQPSSEYLLQSVLTGEIKYDDIVRSQFFNTQLKKRIKACESLEDYLDDKGAVFECDNLRSKINTQIQADYMMMKVSSGSDKSNIFIFLSRRNDNPIDSGLVSIINDPRDFSVGLPALLYKSKTDARTGETTILFDSGKLAKPLAKTEQTIDTEQLIAQPIKADHTIVVSNGQSVKNSPPSTIVKDDIEQSPDDPYDDNYSAPSYENEVTDFNWSDLFNESDEIVNNILAEEKENAKNIIAATNTNAYNSPYSPHPPESAPNQAEPCSKANTSESRSNGEKPADYPSMSSKNESAADKTISDAARTTQRFVHKPNVLKTLKTPDKTSDNKDFQYD